LAVKKANNKITSAVSKRQSLSSSRPVVDLMIYVEDTTEAVDSTISNYILKFLNYVSTVHMHVQYMCKHAEEI